MAHMAQRTCDRLPLFVWILHLVLAVGSHSVNHTIPPVPSEFYSGYVEEIVTRVEQGLTTTTISLSWTAYNAELQLLREDSFDAASTEVRPGTVSRVEDREIRVVYTINRRTHDCFIKSLSQDETTESAEEKQHTEMLLKPLFTDSSNYSYEGASVVRSAVVDVWSLHHNLTGNESRVSVALTRPGTAVRGLSFQVEDPLLWQLSMTESHSLGDVSTTLNFFDWSYNRPNADVFDTSECFGSADYELLILQIAGRVSEVDEVHLHDSLRSAVANYTGIYPLQVGDIKIIWENGMFIFVSLQISNLTSLARTERRVSAFEALRAIKSNLSSSWRLPFAVELRPGVQETPILYTNTIQDVDFFYEPSLQPSHSMTLSSELYATSATSTYPQTSSTPAFSITPTTVLSSMSSVSRVSSTVTVSPAPSTSTGCAVLTPNTPLTLVHTVTKTVSCSPNKPVATHTPNRNTHIITGLPPVSPNSPCVAGLSAGGAVGIGIGAFIGGILASFLTIVLCVLCCNWCNHRTMKREGWQPISRTKHEMDYFQ